MQSEKKLKLYGMLADDVDLDLKLVVQELKTPITTLRKWKKDYKDSIEESKVDKLLAVEEIVIDRVAEEVTEELEEIQVKAILDGKPIKTSDEPPEPLEIDTVTNEVISASELEKRVEARSEALNILERKRQTRLEIFKDNVKGLNILKSETQATAASLVYLIAEQVDRLGASGDENALLNRDIQGLTSALTSIQNAFFNRPVTNVSVNTQNNVGGDSLSEFRKTLKR